MNSLQKGDRRAKKANRRGEGRKMKAKSREYSLDLAHDGRPRFG
jgi:hypothetical protein